MPFGSREYDPETIAFLDECLAIATAAACRVTGSLPSAELRQRLAVALIEGADARVGNRDELIDFALMSLAEFRRHMAH